MSGLHYNDAGSGPHDVDSKLNDRMERNCGCRHDGHTWTSMCETARQAYQERHVQAQNDRAVSSSGIGLVRELRS